MLLADTQFVRTGSALVVVGALLLGAGPAFAHDDIEYIDDGVLDSGKETHNHHYQHNEEETPVLAPMTTAEMSLAAR